MHRKVDGGGMTIKPTRRWSDDKNDELCTRDELLYRDVMCHDLQP